MRPTLAQKLRYLAHRLRITGPIALTAVAIGIALAVYMRLVDTSDPVWPLWALWTGPSVAILVGMCGYWWGGATYTIDGATYRIESPEDAPSVEQIRRAHEQWTGERYLVSVGHDTSPYAIIDQMTVTATATREKAYTDERAAKSWWRNKKIRIAAGDLCTDEHLHELDHLLAGSLFGERDGWGELSHDDRIALLEDT